MEEALRCLEVLEVEEKKECIKLALEDLERLGKEIQGQSGFPHRGLIYIYILYYYY